LTLTSSPRASSGPGEYVEPKRLNVPLLLGVLVPQFVAALVLADLLALANGIAVVIAVVGVVGIVVYRQYAARLAEHPGYERVSALHRLMALAVITSIILLFATVVRFAFDVATGACACG
jgi:hypothetical protein